MKSQMHSSCSKEFTLCINKRLTVAKAQGSISHFQLSALIWLISSHIHWILRNRARIWARHHQLARWQLPSARGGPGFDGVSSDHHQTAEQIAAPHSSPNPAGHLSVFLTLLKQIREARSVMMLIWPYYGLCSVLLGDPVHHCGWSFPWAINFDICPAEYHKHFVVMRSL